MPKITVHRKREQIAVLVRYAVILDGHRVGKLARGRTVSIDVPEGRHELEVRIGWHSSGLRGVDLSEDAEYICMANPPKRLWSAFFDALRPDRPYILLHKLEAGAEMLEPKLEPPNWVEWLLVAVSAAFVVAGIWLLPRNQSVGIRSIAFFGLCMVVFAAMLLRRLRAIRSVRERSGQP